MYICTVQIYGELQHENSISILEETIITCLEKADVLKCNYISIPLWSFPCKKWPSGLAVKVKIPSVVTSTGRSMLVGCVWFVRDDNLLSHAK